ncbi:MAG: hypothetical protein WC310_02585 [Patescibacteria group bacterium]|jgi:hypothetical protein
MPNKENNSLFRPVGKEKKRTAEQEVALEVLLEFLLVKHAHKVNEGSKGVIYHLNTTEVAADIMASLEKTDTRLESEEALKVLKIYNPGEGVEEFAMQSMAYEIVETARQMGMTDLASVPKPILFKKLKIKSEDQKMLEGDGIEFDDDGDVEMIVMDFIHGEDLATIYYKAVVWDRLQKEYHAKGASPDSPEYQTAKQAFDDICRNGFDRISQEATANLFNQTRALDSSGVERENTKRLWDKLREIKFSLSGDIPRQIERTIRLFEACGFEYLDGHQRNFMVSGDIRSLGGPDAPQTSIIDYGKAVKRNQPISTMPDRYKDQVMGQEVSYRDPHSIVTEINMINKVITASPESNKQERIKEVRGLIDTEKKSARHKNLLAAISAQGTEKSVPAIEQLARKAHPDKDYGVGLCTAVLSLIESGELSKAESVAYLQDVLEETTIKEIIGSAFLQGKTREDLVVEMQKIEQKEKKAVKSGKELSEKSKKMKQVLNKVLPYLEEIKAEVDDLRGVPGQLTTEVKNNFRVIGQFLTLLDSGDTQAIERQHIFSLQDREVIEQVAKKFLSIT